MNFKAIAAASLVAVTAIGADIAPSKAGTLSASEAYQFCQAAREANSMGMSVKPMIQQVLASKGAPTYLANVIMSEMKPYCPRAY